MIVEKDGIIPRKFQEWTLETMDKDERSLLLFLESCAVEHGGRVDIRHMNPQDLQIICQWVDEKLIEWGRIKSKDIKLHFTHWVILSDKAWKLAHKERRARCERLMKSQGNQFEKTKGE